MDELKIYVADAASDRLPHGNETLMLLRARVAEVMIIEETQELAAGQAVAFKGRLRIGAQEAFERLKARFTDLGYVPLLRESDSGERQEVMALKGSLQTLLTQRPWVNLLLFLATVFTTTLFGGMFAAALTPGGDLSLPSILESGVPFSLTLLAILAVHELGHYVQARRHGVPVTLPYFIPVPLPGTLGTFGAFIQMRGAVENRRALFDVGMGGPIAGLLVAVPLFVVGLALATLSQDPPPPTRSYLITLLIVLFRPEALDYGIIMNPVLLAARFGLVITALNLLPVGQLDGGHIAYAALGRQWARRVGLVTVAIMAVLGLTVSPTWLIWMAFAVFSGLNHAQPLNDITPLDLRRNAAFIGAFVLFLSIFTLRPF
ncbi:MAG: site-2 protease family protein [Chloroflexi bacterium]|jgi:membrane-associated protease RseP (regulator of RpoE activity)|uniref:Site-2 protease family protein n=1 Tax=Candidatus Thermofonsia Clade 3 bacterium TaxID=2364212 RepID=A0A2M8QE39_9CHLR|nr:site-2 protease family protein [Candidatus Roseilinea sp. NK_OTU-006]PJF48067.1 MAG: site-2 protease family protein [Candidatus Thermofonsia Clade 3 bacterium]RMG63707.1 MAG: site-2 protease family protein [Chloroflexota bacterium]